MRMTTLIENTLWKNTLTYWTEAQLAHYLGGSADSVAARIRRAVEKKLLIHVKRGLYYLGERLTVKRHHPFELAQWIYGPSYLSLELAMSFHNLIPEAVYTITSATCKRNKEFTTPTRMFSYQRVPTENFLIGVERIQDGNYSYLMATPWKAILDYIYCYKMNWDSIDPLEGSLRIELEDLVKISSDDLMQLQTFYRSSRIDRFIQNIPRELIL